MQTYGIKLDDVILICSKNALPKDAVLNKANQDIDVINYAGKNYCSAILCGKDDNIVLKLLKKSPKKLFAQIKAGSLFLK